MEAMKGLFRKEKRGVRDATTEDEGVYSDTRLKSEGGEAKKSDAYSLRKIARRGIEPLPPP